MLRSGVVAVVEAVDIGIVGEDIVAIVVHNYFFDTYYLLESNKVCIYVSIIS